MKNATYVYCVVKRARAAKLAKAPRGSGNPKQKGFVASEASGNPKQKGFVASEASGNPKQKGLEGSGKLRILDAGDGYALLATTVPLALYDAQTIDEHLRDLDWVGARAAEHEAVVEHAATLGTVIPMKLFTIFGTDERAEAHVEKLKRSLGRIVERIAGCEEWGLRILFDEARAARAAAEEARAKKVVTGTSFLLRKKELDQERRSAGARAAAEVDVLYDALAEIARSAKRRAAPNRELAGRVLLDAVFLVPQKSVTRIKKTIGGAAKELVAEGFDVTLTGPWPAYSFIGAQ